MLCFQAAKKENSPCAFERRKKYFCKLDIFPLAESHSLKLTNKLRAIRLVFPAVPLLSGAEMARLAAPATSPCGYLSAPPTPRAVNNPAALV